MELTDTIARETKYKFRRLSTRNKILVLYKLKFGDGDYDSVGRDIGLSGTQVQKICNMTIRKLKHKETYHG